MKVYHWDFFGPAAQATANHFEIHLKRFLETEGITGCKTGVASEATGHVGAWCLAPDDVAQPIIDALKPRRATLPEPSV